MRPYCVAIVGSARRDTSQPRRAKFVDASVNDGGPDTSGSTCWRCCPTPVGSAFRCGSGSSEDQVDQQDVREDRTSMGVSGSSATSNRAPRRSGRVGRALRRGGLCGGARNPTGHWSSRRAVARGSVAAVDFVGWYNAHPHFEEMAPDLSSGRAVVVGNGNVAIDVARILVTDPDVLAATDIADHALTSLHERGVEEVVIIGRRGPLQSAFTTLELRELGELEGVDVIIDPADLADITDDDAGPPARSPKPTSRCCATMRRGNLGRTTGIVFPDSRLRPSRSAAPTGSSRSSWVATNSSPMAPAGFRPWTPGSGKPWPLSWWSAPSATAVCRPRACPSTRNSGTIPHKRGQGVQQRQSIRGGLDQAWTVGGDRRQQGDS